MESEIEILRGIKESKDICAKCDGKGIITHYDEFSMPISCHHCPQCLGQGKQLNLLQLKTVLEMRKKIHAQMMAQL